MPPDGPSIGPEVPDSDFMIDDYIVAPVDIPLSSSENIFTVKYVVKAPDRWEMFII